ncbi:MAG: restriction endonuclease subunit S [Acidobacteriia bacterium]|nr:restriction endonuclease subunit S [Terriglobia bacterium]
MGAIDSNNGLTALIGQPTIHDGNTITVNYNGNGVAEAFYQTKPFWCSDDVNVLYPNFTLTPAIALFIATVIRLERYRFNYGRKWHLDRMRSAVLRLPARADGAPDWLYMEQYIKSLPFSSQIKNG